ncbi:MAG: hypothetical protein JWO36_5977 [Myxococcales bacterium]|nr:hypothetical protein [Myxococcales bacterium]
MTGEASRAVAARLGFVRRVAARACRVIRDAMKPRKLLLVVATLAGRWRDRSVRAVRPMATRTVDVSVLGLNFRRMTAPATRPRVARVVRLVTARARLMPRWRGRRLRAMTCRARGRWRLRIVICIRVALRALGVAGADSCRDLVRVTCRAQRGGSDRLRTVGGMAGRASGVAGAPGRARTIGMTTRAGNGARLRSPSVRRVAIETRRGRMTCRRMARRASNSLRSCRQRRRMRRMATGAFAGWRRGMADLLLVTRRTGAGRVVVR